MKFSMAKFEGGAMTRKRIRPSKAIKLGRVELRTVLNIKYLGRVIEVKGGCRDGSTYSKTEAQRQLDESNKGHQILCKMGWSGAGLGAKEQGIEQPISGGEVRDRTDMYKGVGINLNDPYENFRKSKGQAFINRMKARAEERL
ncbi:unnamed protein product [Timema podura]|uniref:G-patch domain-containing protein n=1 Tax=Timema podura TaxID=61482 RepID=A0ABN7NY97_TIMPD|nr:unnamed protein product [Timema podura]